MNNPAKEDANKGTNFLMPDAQVLQQGTILAMHKKMEKKNHIKKTEMVKLRLVLHLHRSVLHLNK